MKKQEGENIINNNEKIVLAIVIIGTLWIIYNTYLFINSLFHSPI
jgi:hypothetical protein